MVAERILSTDDVRAALRADGVPDSTIDAVIEYVRRNPIIWREFEKEVLRCIALKRRCGAKAIWEYIRHDIHVRTDRKYKANNNFPTYLSRIFEVKHPGYAGYFRKRAVKGLSRVAA